MALKLFAVLVALAVLFFVPAVARFRRWQWYGAWLRRLDGSAGWSWVLLAVVAPTLIVVLLLLWLRGSLAGDFLWWLVAVGVLILTLNEFEPDVAAVLSAHDRTARVAAAHALYADAVVDDELRAGNLVETTVLAALRRRFGVLFWFFLLGPAGALLFRLAERAARTAAASDDVAARRVSQRFAAALDWLPAHLMTLAMALVSNFEAVRQAWAAWHAEPGRKTWVFDSGFLAAVSRVGVEDEDEDGDPDAADDAAVDALATMARTLTRVLVLWLAAVALVVLAGWLH